MTLATSIKFSEARTLVVGKATPAAIRVPEARVLAPANIPTDFVNATEARVLPVVSDPAVIEVAQARVLVVARGHISDPSVRAWTFTLDGHDYYVLHLGETETLVYDTSAEQWYNWGSDSFKYWRALNGCNWLSGTGVGAAYGSNVIVGDYLNGAIYFLSPDDDADDDPTFGAATPHAFERIAQGQILSKGYGGQPCYGVQLQGSIGQIVDADSAVVTLAYSDDRGNSYAAAGTLTTVPGDYDVRLHWRSLGSIKSPGRLFKITDYGALRRIDALDMDDGE